MAERRHAFSLDDFLECLTVRPQSLFHGKVEAESTSRDPQTEKSGNLETDSSLIESFKKLTLSRKHDKSASMWTTEDLKPIITADNVTVIQPRNRYEYDVEEEILDVVDIIHHTLPPEFRAFHIYRPILTLQEGILINAILQPLCEKMGQAVEWTGTSPCTYQCTYYNPIVSTYGYILHKQKKLIGVVETVTQFSLTNESVVQILVQLLMLSSENPKLPHYSISTDGYMVIFVGVVDDKVRFYRQEQKNEIELIKITDWGFPWNRKPLEKIVGRLFSIINEALKKAQEQQEKKEQEKGETKRGKEVAVDEGFVSQSMTFTIERKRNKEKIWEEITDHHTSLKVVLEKPKTEHKVITARSLALQFMAAHPCCVRAIPYKENEEESITMSLYIDSGDEKIPQSIKESAEEIFTDYQIKYVDLQRQPLQKLVTQLPSHLKQKDQQELSDLAEVIEKNLKVFSTSLNVTAIKPSYKIKDYIEQPTVCITVFVLGKGKIPLGEKEFSEENTFGDQPIDIMEGYYRSCDTKSYTSPLQAGVGIGVKDGAGTLGGFLEDDSGEHYLLSCQHVLRPNEDCKEDIVQPAQCDYDKELEQVNSNVNDHRRLLQKAEQKSENAIDERERARFEGHVERRRRELERAESHLEELEERTPRVIGKYSFGLKRDVVVNGHRVYVDAAIAKLEHEEFLAIKDLADEDHCSLYGFQNDGDYSYQNTIVKQSDIKQNISSPYRKTGRSTGLTKKGQLDTENYFVNCGGPLSARGELTDLNVYCQECKQKNFERTVLVDLALLGTPHCSTCEKEIEVVNVYANWACNCIGIRQPQMLFAEKGDSGALVFDNDGRACAMIFGTFEIGSLNTTIAIASPIEVILSELQKISEIKELRLWHVEQNTEQN